MISISTYSAFFLICKLLRFVFIVGITIPYSPFSFIFSSYFSITYLSSLQLQTSFLFIILISFTFITYCSLLFTYYPSILTILLTGFLCTYIYHAPLCYYVILRCFYLQHPKVFYIRVSLFYFTIPTCPRCSSRHT